MSTVRALWRIDVDADHHTGERHFVRFLLGVERPVPQAMVSRTGLFQLARRFLDLVFSLEDEPHSGSYSLRGCLVVALRPRRRRAGSHELVEVAVEDLLRVRALHAGAQVLHHLIGLQHARNGSGVPSRCRSCWPRPRRGSASRFCSSTS